MAFLFKAESQSAARTEHIVLIPSSDGPPTAVVTAGVHVGVRMPLRDPASALLGVCPRVGLLDQKCCV